MGCTRTETRRYSRFALRSGVISCFLEVTPCFDAGDLSRPAPAILAGGLHPVSWRRVGGSRHAFALGAVSLTARCSVYPARAAGCPGIRGQGRRVRRRLRRLSWLRSESCLAEPASTRWTVTDGPERPECMDCAGSRAESHTFGTHEQKPRHWAHAARLCDWWSASRVLAAGRR